MHEGEKRLNVAIAILGILLVLVIFFSRIDTVGASATVHQRTDNGCIVIKTDSETTIWSDGKVLLKAEIGPTATPTPPTNTKKYHNRNQNH